MRLTPLEKETIISFNEEEQTASVYTYDSKLKRRLKELCNKRPNEAMVKRTDNMVIECVIPKHWIKINPSAALSEQRKAQLAANLKSILPSETPYV